MKRRLRLLLAATLLLGAGVGSAEEKDAGSDQESIQGTWKIVSATVDGRDTTEELDKDITLVITKDKITSLIGGKSDHQTTYKLDPTKKPKTIDTTDIKDDGQPGKTTLGIYQLSGDELKLAAALKSGSDRPAAFDAKDDAKGVLQVVLKRVKP